jgi:alpha-beta hydrolase superfamily lysophospholipase
MTIAKARRDDIEIAYETFGPPGNPLLLVMGVGAQMLYWHDEFCAALAARGFWVARFGNPDAGLSSHLSLAGVPNQLKMLRRRPRRPSTAWRTWRTTPWPCSTRSDGGRPMWSAGRWAG